MHVLANVRMADAVLTLALIVVIAIMVLVAMTIEAGVWDVAVSNKTSSAVLILAADAGKQRRSRWGEVNGMTTRSATQFTSRFSTHL